MTTTRIHTAPETLYLLHPLQRTYSFCGFPTARSKYR